MNLTEDLERAGENFENSYDQMLEAVETEGQMSDTAEQYFTEAHEYITDELDSFEEELGSAYEDITSASDTEDANSAIVSLEAAGQSLVNAYQVVTTAYNKAESTMANGDEAFESNTARISLAQEIENMDLLNEAVGDKEEAFKQYQEALESVTGEVTDFYQEQGLMSHIDVGLGQQQPQTGEIL